MKIVMIRVVFSVALLCLIVTGVFAATKSTENSDRRIASYYQLDAPVQYLDELTLAAIDETIQYLISPRSIDNIRKGVHRENPAGPPVSLGQDGGGIKAARTYNVVR